MEIESLEVKRVISFFVRIGEGFNFSKGFMDDNGLFFSKDENVNGEF